jgi:hypothetical protein
MNEIISRVRTQLETSDDEMLMLSRADIRNVLQVVDRLYQDNATLRIIANQFKEGYSYLRDGDLVKTRECINNAHKAYQDRFTTEGIDWWK